MAANANPHALRESLMSVFSRFETVFARFLWSWPSEKPTSPTSLTLLIAAHVPLVPGCG